MEEIYENIKLFSWGEFTSATDSSEHRLYSSNEYYIDDYGERCYYMNTNPIFSEEKIILLTPNDANVATWTDKYHNNIIYFIFNLIPTNINVVELMIQIINETNFQYLPDDYYYHCNNLQDAILVNTHYLNEHNCPYIVTKFNNEIHINYMESEMIDQREFIISLTNDQCQILAEYIYSNKEKFFNKLNSEDFDRDIYRRSYKYNPLYKDDIFYIIDVDGYIDIYAKLKNNIIIYLTDNAETGNGYSLKYVRNLYELIMKGSK